MEGLLGPEPAISCRAGHKRTALKSRSDVLRDEPRARADFAAREGYSCNFHYVNPPLSGASSE